MAAKFQGSNLILSWLKTIFVIPKEVSSSLNSPPSDITKKLCSKKLMISHGTMCSNTIQEHFEI